MSNCAILCIVANCEDFAVSYYYDKESMDVVGYCNRCNWRRPDYEREMETVLIPITKEEAMVARIMQS